MLKPGDLVMIVKPRECCGSTNTLGAIRTVSDRLPSDEAMCRTCGFISKTEGYIPLNDNTVCESSRLKKIEPGNGVDEIIRIAGLPKKIPRKKLIFHLDPKRLAF